MSLETNKELLRSHIEVFLNTGNRALAYQQLAPDFIDHGSDQELRGPEVAMQAYTTHHQAVPDLRFVLHDVIAEGDKVATLISWSGTHVNDYGPVKATGKLTGSVAVILWRIDERGQIAERWASRFLGSAIHDAQATLTVLGRVPPTEVETAR